VPKGHSLLEPRIAALEKQFAEWANTIQFQIDVSVETRLRAMGKEPSLNPKEYVSAFEKWPGNGASQ
jgi:hypothetical protein